MKRYVGTIVRSTLLVVILVAFVAFVRSITWHDTWRTVRSASPGLFAAATVVNLLSLALKALRWWIFLRPIGVTSFGLALRATFAGAALNNVIVANGGEAARVVFVSRASRVSNERVLATLTLELLFEFVGYASLLAFAVAFLRLPPAIDEARPFAFAAAVVVLAVLVYLVRHPERAELPALDGDGLLRRARAYGRTFLQTLTGISTGRRFAAALSVTVTVWSLQVATYALTAKAAHFNLSIAGTIATILVVNLGFAVRATPGGVGVFQMMYVLTAASFGMDAAHATGVALLIQAQQILPVTLIGLVAAPQMLFERGRQASRLVDGDAGIAAPAAS